MLLSNIEISNFRSIKGRIAAPLDARIVLVHGENGAGKTSLLSAIELALTGRALPLERADPAYQRHLLHWSTQAGSIRLDTDDGAAFETTLSAEGARAATKLPDAAAAFFSERCYLPQSLLGQLLHIYQSSNDELGSPLARFVGELLGLDRLDALDAGLRPLQDLRNFRKIADGYGNAESEKARSERLVADHRRNLDGIGTALTEAMVELTAARIAIGLPPAVDEGSLDRSLAELSPLPDEGDLAHLADLRRQLEAIRREATRDRDVAASGDEPSLSAAHALALGALEEWRRKHEARVTAVRKHAEALLPSADLPASPQAFADSSLKLLRAERQQAAGRSDLAAQAIRRRSAAEAELEVARKQLEAIDGEIGRVAPTAGDLGAALAQITSFIVDEVCPVCDRDFAEREAGRLANHVHRKVQTLSASARRLLDLSRTRGQQQGRIEALERELATLSSRLVDDGQASNLSRISAALEAAVSEIEALANILAEGEVLTRSETAARRALSERQARDLARTSAMATLREFALSANQAPPTENETVDNVVERLSLVFQARASEFERRMSARRKGVEAIRKAKAEIRRRTELDAVLTGDATIVGQNTAALRRANALRASGQTLRGLVETVRGDIIRREFNDRLNRLWRDLFIRLAPNEPFVPAFKIPEVTTHRLQPRLITEHRGGGSGGTPGAMLSAGNLNTAALTLFTALHLTVPAQRPWMILDDPVQSMDDVHIANFAALLRILAKEHGRQVIIAVHDRHLFEYLRLELSPAYPEDSLLALELSRGVHQDSLCTADRRSYREETALRVAA